MEGKGLGLGVGVVIVALGALWLWSKKKPAEAAPAAVVPAAPAAEVEVIEASIQAGVAPIGADYLTKALAKEELTNPFVDVKDTQASMVLEADAEAKMKTLPPGNQCTRTFCKDGWYYSCCNGYAIKQFEADWCYYRKAGAPPPGGWIPKNNDPFTGDVITPKPDYMKPAEVVAPEVEVAPAAPVAELTREEAWNILATAPMGSPEREQAIAILKATA